MSSIEKLILSRLEDRVMHLEHSYGDLAARIEMLEIAVCAASDGVAELLRRVDDLEKRLVGFMSEPR